jgi:hypothetical protein
LLEEIKGFDEEVTLMEDVDAFFRLSFKTEFCFVSDPLVRIDRKPGRGEALCDLFATRSDRKYDDLRRLHRRWLSMPEVIGTKYEHSVRKSLRLLCYDCMESNIHRFRLQAVVREFIDLRVLEENYTSIVFNLISRKIKKVRGKSKSHYEQSIKELLHKESS